MAFVPRDRDRRTGRLAALASLCLIMAACGPAASSASTSSATPATATQSAGDSPAATAAEPVTLTFWHLQVGPLEESLKAAVADFEASHPGITIELQQQGDPNTIHQKILSAITAGNTPTMAESFDPSKTSTYLEADALIPVQSLFTGSEDVGSIYANQIRDSTFSVNGQDVLVSWPFARSFDVMWYNPNVLEAAGVVGPPTTLEAFREAARTITAATGKAAFAWTPDAGRAEFYAALIGNGGSLIDAAEQKVEFDSQAGIDALTVFADMAQTDKTLKITQSFDWQAAFAAEEAALALGSTASAAFMPDAITTFTLSWAPFPAGTMSSGNVAYGTTAVVFKNAPKAEQQAAWTFLQWFSQPENQAKWSVGCRFGFAPFTPAALNEGAYTAAIGGSPGVVEAISPALENAVPRPRTPKWTEIESYISDALLAATSGATTPADALHEAAEKANVLLAGN